MRTLLIILISVIVFIAGIAIYLQPNSLRGCPEVPNGKGNCQPADAIVAVSGGDTNARTDAAIKLYQKGWAPLLIFAGAAQDKSGPSNAAAMAARAVDQGVPAAAIEVDELSATTEENASNVRSIFKQNNVGKVILVTSAYHQRRASLEFNKRTDNVAILNAPTNDSDWSFWWWVTPRGWWLAGGELAKIVVFYAGGIAG